MRLKKKKAPFISTVILILLTIFTFTVGSPPQCPDSYTQAQIDSATQGFYQKCIVGANIGTGLMVMIVLIPLAVVVLVLWTRFIIRKLRTR